MERGVTPAPPRLPAQAVPADYLLLLRPMILVPVWTFFLLGAAHGGEQTGIRASASGLWAGLASFTALMGAVYIVNQIADRSSDRANAKLFLLSHGIVSARAAWTQATLLAAAAVAIAVFLLPPVFLLIVLAGLLLGLAYSLEPLRLKRRPVLDVLANAIGNGALNTLAGWTAAGAPLHGLGLLSPYPPAVAAVHLATTLADAGGDAACGLRTSGVVLGRRRGMLVAAVLMAGSAAVAAGAGNTPALISALVSLPFFAAALRRGGRAGGADGMGAADAAGAGAARAALLPARAATVVYSLAAAFYYPLYLPWLAAVIVATRLYYSRRFGMRYPSL